MSDVKAAGSVVALVAVVVIAAGAIFLYRHIESTDIAVDQARAEFERARARFVGQQPLLEVTTAGIVRYPTPDTPRRPVSAVHVITYDADAGELTRVDMPGWALRLVPSLSGISLFERLQLTHGTGLDITREDIERHGPGVIVDIRRPETMGLAWTE